MYRLIFLVLFSIPISGMNLEWHPSPKEVIHMSGIEGTKFKEVIETKSEKLHIKRFSSHANNNPNDIKCEFWGECEDKGAKIELSEPEAELFFNSLIRKYSLIQLTKTQLLAKLNANQNANAYPMDIGITPENIMN